MKSGLNEIIISYKGEKNTMNNIKNVKFHLENCESILVPFECFKEFKIIENNKNPNEIFIFECIIVDNGKVNYSTTWHNNITSPIYRLSQYNDICYIIITYNDGSIKEYSVRWYDNDPHNNKNQTSKMHDYKTIHIKIKPYIKKYTIDKVFKFKVGTKFKDNQNNIYIIMKQNNTKKLCLFQQNSIKDLLLEAKYINTKFIKIKK